MLQTMYHMPRKDEQLRKKMEILKVEAFPRRKFFDSNNSKKTLLNKKSLSKDPNSLRSTHKFASNLTSRQKNNQEHLKKTTIQFRSAEVEKKEQSLMTWAVQSWYPKNSSSSSSLHRKKSTFFKQAKEIFQFEDKPSSQIIKEKSLKGFRVRDAQSLLKKNSLFLLNFIKTKQKKNKSTPHFGNVPLIYDQRPKLSSTPNLQPLVSHPIEEEGSKKKKKGMTPFVSEKKYQNADYQSKFTIFPEPW